MENTKMKKTFTVKGMHCNSCAMLIESELEGDVKKIKVDYSSENAKIDFDEKKVSEKKIIDKISKLGYKVT